MRKAILILINVLFLFNLITIAKAETVALSDIDSNDHISLASYYENQAKEVSAKLSASKKELSEYENHPYTYPRMPYGIRGQDLSSYLKANIREYNKELVEDLKQMEMHKSMSMMGENK